MPDSLCKPGRAASGASYAVMPWAGAAAVDGLEIDFR